MDAFLIILFTANMKMVVIDQPSVESCLEAQVAVMEKYADHKKEHQIFCMEADAAYVKKGGFRADLLELKKQAEMASE